MIGPFEDYVIDHDLVDWSTALTTWGWLLPLEFTLWIVNRLCDLFIVTADGNVHLMDVGCGSLKTVAASREDFCQLIDQSNNVNEWLAIPLVDQLIQAGVHLQPGQCYGFKIPPVLGGQYTAENCAAISIPDYLGAFGSIHGQIQDLPDGSQVRLKVVD